MLILPRGGDGRPPPDPPGRIGTPGGRRGRDLVEFGTGRGDPIPAAAAAADPPTAARPPQRRSGPGRPRGRAGTDPPGPRPRGIRGARGGSNENKRLNFMAHGRGVQA